MALQKFRDKQKLITWIATLLVVPAFILMGFIGLFTANSQSPVVGSIEGTDYNYRELLDFNVGLSQVNFGQPVSFEINNQKIPQEAGGFFALVLRDEAVLNGVAVSELEINSYIDTYVRLRFGAEKFTKKELAKMLKSSSIDMEVFEFKEAVKNWLLIKKFLGIIDNSMLAPSLLAELAAGQEKSQYTYKQLEYFASDFLEEATKALNDLPPEQLQARAQKFIENNQKEELKDGSPFLWTDAKWTLDYIFVPYVVAGLEPKITPEKLKTYYDSNKNKYANEKGEDKPFEEVRSAVENDYREYYRQQTALQTLDNEYRRFINRNLQNLKSGDEIKLVTVEDIKTDPRLISRGLKAERVSSEPLTEAEIAALPVFKGTMVSFMLTTADRQLRAAEHAVSLAADSQQKKEELKRLQDNYFRSFRGFSFPGASKESPLKSNDGLIKVRIAQYIPGEKRTLLKVDGSIDEDLLSSIKSVLARDDSLILAEEKAKAATALFAAGATIPEGEKEPVEKKTMYYDLVNARSQMNPREKLRSAAIGEVVGPLPAVSAPGYEVLQLVARTQIEDKGTKLPQSLAQQLTSMELSMRGNSIYTPSNLMTPRIKMGRRLVEFITVLSNDRRVNYVGLPRR